MRKILFSLLFLFISTLSFSQTTKKEAEKIAVFSKIWGFLKYYHPAVAHGTFDWDKEFITHISELDKLNSKEEISSFYLQWINSLGSIDNCRKCEMEVADSLKRNLDLLWLNDSETFTDSLISRLNFVAKNRNQQSNYYVHKNFIVGNTTFKNEKPYNDSVFPSAPLRLLALSRYWNIINYFYPYKYKIGTNWNDVLVEMIPKFKDAQDTMQYHLAMLELTVKINDSHGMFATSYTNKFFGIKWAPFRFKIIDDKAVVTSFYNDSLCKLDDIKVGDVFLSVENTSIKNIIAQRWKYIAGSNDAAKLRNFYYAVFNGNTDSVKTTCERNGILNRKIVHRYLNKNFSLLKDDSTLYKILDGNIGYVNLDKLQHKQVKDVLGKLRNTTAIIFDVRNYPKGTLYDIAEFLNEEKKTFAKIAKPELSYPGVFTFNSLPYCGRKNKNPYKGKVVLLFNEWTQSHGEYTLMALQTFPNTIGVGSQTGGADGDISEITFPGNYKTYMTGIGVYYPDGRETQRVGIIPDVVVKPTIEGIKEGKDEVLEKAIEVIRK